MKKQLLSAALAATLGFAVVPFAANASSSNTNTLTINGQVVSQTCVISVNGTSNTVNAGASPTVTLPTVNAAQFSASGQSAGWTPVTISISGCTAPATGAASTVAPYFQNGATVTIDPSTGYLKNSGTATGVEVALSTAGSSASALQLQNSGAISGGKTGQGVVAQSIPTSASGSVSFPLFAGYVSTGASVGAGSVSTTVNYDLSYN